MKKFFIKEIEKIRNDKFYAIIKIIVTLCFAITMFFDYSLNYIGWIYGTVSENCFSEIGLINYLILFLTWICSYIIMSIVENCVDKIEKNSKNIQNRKSKKIYFIIWILLIISWLPYVLSYFPGGIFADTKASIKQALTGEYKNRNPILYALAIKLCFVITGNSQSGMELFTVLQVLGMSAVIAYAIYWLYKRNLSTKYIALVTIFFCFFRLVPQYAIAIWKDTPFSVALLLYTIIIADIVYSKGKNLEKISGTLKYVIAILLVAWLRNNGIYIVIATTIAITIVYRKTILKTSKKFVAGSTIAIITTMMIQGPIFSHFKMNAKFVESLGIPLQQICYVIVTDGNITEEQLEFINNIIPIENIKEKFAPCIVDGIKLDSNFSNEFLENNKTEFFKIWFKVFLKNPKAYVKEYLLSTIGFWNINKLDTAAYINPQMWEKSDETMGIRQSDYIEKITGKSIRNIITPKKATSAVAYLMVIIIGALIVVYKKKYKSLLIYLPTILTWGTILIAVPIAFSFRYVFIFVLLAPISIGIPFIKNQDENTSNDN